MLKYIHRMMFLDEDSGGDFGGAETSRGMEVFEGGGEPQPPGHEPEPQQAREPQQQHQPPPQAPPSFVDARQLANEFGNVLGQQFRPQQPQMTQEEAKRLLNFWEPTPEWLAKYDNLETRQQAIAEQRDGLIRQADTIMQFRMREMMDQMQQTYGPVVQYMQQAEAQRGEQRFSQNYPQLSNPGLRPVLFAVAQSLLANGVQFQNERHMFDTIARGVESVIKVNNPGFSLQGNGVANGRPRQQVRPRAGGGIPVTTPGSGVAGGGGEAPTGMRKPRGLAIWD